MADKTHDPKQTKLAVTKQRTPAPAERGAGFDAKTVLADPRLASSAQLLALQHVAGNRAAARLIQTKLTVGPAHDRYEQEADRVAQQAMSMSAPAQSQPAVQRAPEEEEEVQMKPLAAPLAASITPIAQRRAEEEEEEVQTKPLAQRQEEEVQMKPLVQVVQRHSTSAPNAPLTEEDQLPVQLKPIAQRQSPTGGFEANDEIAERIQAQQGGGAALPDETREFMETRIGADFSGVRVHTGREAAQLSRDLSAQAFTQGNNIFFGEAQYAPQGSSGKQLLAHELTHVVQQGGAQRHLQTKPSFELMRPAAPQPARNLWARHAQAGAIQRQDDDEVASPPTRARSNSVTAMKFDDIRFSPKEVPADGVASSQASVKTSDSSRPVTWSLVGDTYGSTIKDTGLITTGNDLKGKEEVKLQVKATDSSAPTASATGELTLLEAKYYQAKKDYPQFLAGAPYTYPDFTIGLNGKFDVEYQPAAKQADVNVKVKFSFPDDPDVEVAPSIWNLWGLIGKEEREERAARHQAYRKSFVQQITDQWSQRYQFKNVREPQSVWGKLNPTTLKVNVVEVKKDQHFEIKVNEKTEGRAQVGGGVTNLYKGSETPKPAFNPSTAQGEITRVQRIIPEIRFDNNSADLPPAVLPKLQFLADYLKRINNPKFKLDIVGHASATGDPTQNKTLSEQRAQAVANALTTGGAVQHKLEASGVGQAGASDGPEWRKVDITPSLNPGWENVQDVTAHEFGHMIGLGDEYAGGGSPTATHYNLVKKAFGQEYADQVAKRGDTDYASIMEGGNDVRIQHYVTFWSGLAETTLKAPVPDPKFGYDDWKFIG